MKGLLLLPVVVGLAAGGVTWNKNNCNPEGANGAVKGVVSDALCTDYPDCIKINHLEDGVDREEKCNELPICLWDDSESLCKMNRDLKNNVCAAENSVKKVCHSITMGKCPREWQVLKSCCTGENAKYADFLSTDDDSRYVCCNLPCQALTESIESKPAECTWDDHSHNKQCLPGVGARSYFGPEGGPGYHSADSIYKITGMNPHKPMEYGNVVPGFGHQGLGNYGPTALEEVGVGNSKKLHTEEITVDDLFETLISALDTDRDVFEYNKEINSDPWFNKQAFGGYTDQFSFIDPYKFLDKIYGSEFGLTQAKTAYKNMYGLKNDLGKGDFSSGGYTQNPYALSKQYGSSYDPYNPLYGQPGYDRYQPSYNRYEPHHNRHNQYNSQHNQYNPHDRYNPRDQYNPQPHYNPQDQYKPQPEQYQPHNEYNPEPEPYLPPSNEYNPPETYDEPSDQYNIPEQPYEPPSHEQYPHFRDSNPNIGGGQPGGGAPSQPAPGVAGQQPQPQPHQAGGAAWHVAPQPQPGAWAQQGGVQHGGHPQQPDPWAHQGNPWALNPEQPTVNPWTQPDPWAAGGAHQWGHQTNPQQHVAQPQGGQWAGQGQWGVPINVNVGQIYPEQAHAHGGGGGGGAAPAAEQAGQGGVQPHAESYPEPATRRKRSSRRKRRDV